MLRCIALQDQITWLKAFQTETALESGTEISSNDASRIAKILQSQLMLQLNSNEASSSQTPLPGTSESELLRTTALEAADLLAEHKINREKLATAGIVPSLVGLLKIVTDERQVEATLRGLQLFAMEQSNHKQMTKAGAVEPLLRMCYSDTKALQILAAATVADLAQAKPNWPPLIKAGLIPAILHLLKSRSERAKSAAVLSVVGLNNDPGNHIPLGEAGVIPLIVPLLRGPEIQQTAAALALQNLAVPHVNKHRIAEAGAIPLLVAQLKTGNTFVKEGVSGALMNLAQDAGLHSQLIAADGASALAAALKLRIEYVQAYAAGAFMNLSLSEVGAVAATEVSKYLIQESKQSPFPDARKWAAAAVWNLIKGQMIPVFHGTVSIQSANSTEARGSTLDALTPDFDRWGKAMGGWM